MHTLALLSLLTTTLTVTLTHAIPLANTGPSSTPSSSAALATPTLTGPNICPGKRSKQCCTSLSQLQTSLLDPVGNVIPLLSGMQLTSLIGLSCRTMSDEHTKTDCADALMCCDAAGEVGASNILQTKCEEFDLAKAKEIAAVERAQGQPSSAARMFGASSSSVVLGSGSGSGPAATPTPTRR
ncbi:uncharacterized protein ACLA_001890 [Aspergillus clavatus NRRL 1]|uniref:Hydrophobin n=1 Tax=Aspergillus clavatus (strain ATCC 1007 / CBS 513.65 / DSM 816 / NCTC 3887 / NRRL 1 / QM 1276 / 107) TaxID=344612 RepID=A1C510_ASPCL|nr:uncharacterized protein ACLA_001890 [Aspergillus clavatus NRRL 1]EAW14778.1 conserved hypothetical protein [Aspergillus clavatus NRRL 1]